MSTEVRITNVVMVALEFTTVNRLSIEWSTIWAIRVK